MYLRERLKWLFFPGLNLHARQRFHRIGQWLAEDRSGPRRVLDAGCGNGMLSFRCYQLGDSVLGISIKEGEIARDQKLFNQMMQIPQERLSFKVHNLYQASELRETFDAIICTEVLEHIADDGQICRMFHGLLKLGGSLHLCCPNAGHPDNDHHEIDSAEAGGHVRAGYTFESYRALLEPIGFQIAREAGLGGPIRQACNKRIIRAEERFGFPVAAALFMICCPLTWFDVEPSTPYSLYVRAVKVN